MRVGLDIMGGDSSPDVPLDGALLALKDLPSSVEIVLIGDKEVIETKLKEKGIGANEFPIIHATDVIEMGEHPARAFQKKPESSIAKGFQALKRNEIDAFASVGNTGAMLVGSMFTVRSVSGVIRPCITSVIPKEDDKVGVILDVGTNADCKPDVLYQFGLLGSLFIEHIYGVKNPKVGLLNIGEEEEKGNLLSRAAFEMMKDSRDFNFIGNVEGRDLFSDKVDVVVCDGFTGNVVLKSLEAFHALVIKRNIKDPFFNRFDYEIYGGTPILGINSNVIIGHGSSSAIAIKNMIKLSVSTIEVGLSSRIKKAFNNE